jgi:hypothetical protein
MGQLNLEYCKQATKSLMGFIRKLRNGSGAFCNVVEIGNVRYEYTACS